MPKLGNGLKNVGDGQQHYHQSNMHGFDISSSGSGKYHLNSGVTNNIQLQ